MKGRIILFVAVVFLVIAVTQAWCSITLTYKDGVNSYAGTRDSWIFKGVDGRQYGAATEIWIKYQEPGDVGDGRVVIKFTGINLPTAAQDVDNIVSVKLRLNAKVWETEGDYISAYGLLKSFNEGAGTGPPDWGNDGVLWGYANWAGYNPPPPTLAWGTPGASATGTAYDTTGVGSADRLATADDSVNVDSTSGYWEGWAEWNVTNSFKNQLTNGKEYGWLLLPTQTKYCAIIVKSRDYSTDASLRPELVIVYNDPVADQVPPVMTYQGKLTDGSGTPVSDGTHQVQFAFYKSETGGAAVWTSAVTDVTTSGGLFTTTIGPVPELAYSGPDNWIEITADTDVLTPRVKLSSVAYALRSDTASNLESGGSIRAKINGQTRLQLGADGSATFTTGTGTGVNLPAGGGSWSSLSDRNAKTNISAVNQTEILEKLSGLEMGTWSYKAQDSSIRHIGPMAQDFYSAFGLGEDSRHISTVDADGVALAAIQGLYKIVLQKDSEIAELKARLEKLENLGNH